MKSNSSQYLRHSLLLLFCAMFLMGTIAVIPLSTLTFGLPKLLFFSLAACSGLAVIWAHNLDLSPLFHTWPGRLFLLFVGITVLSPLWSIAPILSIVGSPPRFEGVLAQVIFLVFGLIGATFMQSEHMRRTLLTTILLGNVIVVLYGALQMVSMDPLALLWQSELFLGRTFSFLGQPTYLGQFILLTLPFVAMHILHSHRKVLWGTMAVMNIIVLIGTTSRAAVLALFVMLVIGAIVLIQTNAIHIRKAHIILLSIVILSLSAFGVTRFSERFSVATQQVSLGARSVIWSTSWKMIQMRPQGYGLETMGIASQQFMPKQLKEFESLKTKIDRAHSKPLELLLTVGPLGFIAYYGLLVLLLWGLYVRTHNNDQMLSATIALSLIGFSVALLAGFESPVTYAFFWLIVGMAIGSIPQRSSLNAQRATKGLLMVLFFMTALTIIIQTQWMRARMEMAQGEQLLRNGDMEESIRVYAYASSLFPLDRQLLIESTEATLIGLEQTKDAQTKEVLNDLISQQLDKLRKLTNGQDGMVSLIHSWQAALAGNHEGVDRLIAEAIALQPNDVTTYRIAAHDYALLGDKEKERAMEQKLIDILPTYWNDPVSEKGRILRKENIWLEQIGL